MWLTPEEEKNQRIHRRFYWTLQYQDTRKAYSFLQSRGRNVYKPTFRTCSNSERRCENANNTCRAEKTLQDYL